MSRPPTSSGGRESRGFQGTPHLGPLSLERTKELSRDIRKRGAQVFGGHLSPSKASKGLWVGRGIKRLIDCSPADS